MALQGAHSQLRNLMLRAARGRVLHEVAHSVLNDTFLVPPLA